MARARPQPEGHGQDHMLPRPRDPVPRHEIEASSSGAGMAELLAIEAAQSSELGEAWTPEDQFKDQQLWLEAHEKELTKTVLGSVVTSAASWETDQPLQ